MQLVEIKNRFNGELIYSCEALSMKECLELALKDNADLRGADLRVADLDFSSWPFSCRSTNAICDDRLFAQLFFHLTRLDESKCSGGVKESMSALRAMAASDLFLEYRSDVGKPVNEQ